MRVNFVTWSNVLRAGCWSINCRVWSHVGLIMGLAGIAGGEGLCPGTDAHTLTPGRLREFPALGLGILFTGGMGGTHGRGVICCSSGDLIPAGSVACPKRGGALNKANTKSEISTDMISLLGWSPCRWVMVSSSIRTAGRRIPLVVARGNFGWTNSEMRTNSHSRHDYVPVLFNSANLLPTSIVV